MNAIEVLEEFADAAKPPTGRRFFDAERGTPAFRPAKPAPDRDWVAFIGERTERRGPDDCWAWRGGARVTISDGRGGRVNGKRVADRPSVAVDFRRLIWRETRGALPPGFVYSTCGAEWCANPRHMTDDPKMRPKQKRTSRKGIEMGKLGAIETRKVPPAKPAQDPHDASVRALASVVEALRSLDDDTRLRILSTVGVFYGVTR